MLLVRAAYMHFSVSANVTCSTMVGGQAFRIKLRKTHERSTTAMLVEPPLGLNGSAVDHYAPPRWRLMKYAPV
jgi:hypothetical protein